MFLKQQKNNLPINNFTIFGERHSGTNFLERLMRGEDSWGTKPTIKAFDLPITWEYGWKHFFGFHDDLLMSSKSNNTLFLGLVRNPYDWIMAMYKMPHHLRPHKAPGWNRFDGLQDFLTASDLESRYYDPAINQKHTDNNPYTLSGYKNIFELRQVKLHYLTHTLPSIIQNYSLVQYENLITHSGKFIENLSTYYNLPILNIIENDRASSRYTIDPEIKSFIDANIDWSLENMCGYTIV